MAPAAGFYSTPADLCRFFSSLLIGNSQLLNDESKKEMQRLQWTNVNNSEEGYGLGLDHIYAGEQRVFGHGDGFIGFNSQTLVHPKDEIVIAAYNNNLDGIAEELVKGAFIMFSFYKDKVTKPNLALDKYEGRFLNLFAVYDFVNCDDGLVTNFPGDWRPFAAKQSLSRLSNNCFLIKDEFSSEEGEKVRFIFKGQDHEKVVYAGETFLPPAVFNELLKNQKILQKLN